jgi:hypothetical protein
LRSVGPKEELWLGDMGGGEGPGVQQGSLLEKHPRERVGLLQGPLGVGKSFV